MFSTSVKIPSGKIVTSEVVKLFASIVSLNSTIIVFVSVALICPCPRLFEIVDDTTNGLWLSKIKFKRAVPETVLPAISVPETETVGELEVEETVQEYCQFDNSVWKFGDFITNFSVPSKEYPGVYSGDVAKYHQKVEVS